MNTYKVPDFRDNCMDEPYIAGATELGILKGWRNTRECRLYRSKLAYHKKRVLCTEDEIKICHEKLVEIYMCLSKSPLLMLFLTHQRKKIEKTLTGLLIAKL